MAGPSPCSFVCSQPECARRFSRKGNLQRHMITLHASPALGGRSVSHAASLPSQTSLTLSSEDDGAPMSDDDSDLAIASRHLPLERKERALSGRPPIGSRPWALRTYAPLPIPDRVPPGEWTPTSMEAAHVSTVEEVRVGFPAMVASIVGSALSWWI